MLHQNTNSLLPNDEKVLDLSQHEELNFEFLTLLIKRDALLEKLILPRIKNDNAETTLRALNAATATNSALTEIEMDLSALGDVIPPAVAFHYYQIQSRLTRNRKRIFAIHGGGNIGLGLMADIVSKSPFEYHTVATSSDVFTNNLINSNHQVWLQHGNEKNSPKTCTKNVNMIHSRNSKNIIELYKQANLVSICLTEEALLQVSDDIAQGIIARYKLDGAGLKILILMNKPNCHEFVKNEISSKILQVTHNYSLTQKILSVIHFVPTMVDRIVSKMERSKILASLRKQLVEISKRPELILEKYSFIDPNKPLQAQIEIILNDPDKLIKAVNSFNLQCAVFNAEQNFMLYVPEDLAEVPRLPAVRTSKNLASLMEVKNKFINGPHAVIAWLGGLKGYTTIAESIKDLKIYNFVLELMEKEIAPILLAAYPQISNHNLEQMKVSFFERGRNNLDDKVTRVGRDVLRKLNEGGCIRGIISLREKYNLKLSISRLERAYAAGILYAVKQIDPTNSECNKIYDIYRMHKSYQAILCYNGPYGSANYPGLNAKQDKRLIDNILWEIYTLERQYQPSTGLLIASSVFGRAISENNCLTLPNAPEKCSRAQTHVFNTGRKVHA